MRRVDPALGAHLLRELVEGLAGQCLQPLRAPSGSIIVALIRVITSPPKGCCLFSREATATGVPVPRSSRVATTVVVPRSKAIA